MSHSHATETWRRLTTHSDRILLALFAALMAFVLYRSSQMGIGSITQPGPGLWPTIVSVATVIACASALIVDKTKPEEFTPSGSLRVAIFAASALVFVPIYNLIGFIPAGIVTTFLLMAFVYRTTWTATLIVTCAAPIAVYAVFGLALGVPLTAFG